MPGTGLAPRPTRTRRKIMKYLDPRLPTLSKVAAIQKSYYELVAPHQMDGTADPEWLLKVKAVYNDSLRQAGAEHLQGRIRAQQTPDIAAMVRAELTRALTARLVTSALIEAYPDGIPVRGVGRVKVRGMHS